MDAYEMRIHIPEIKRAIGSFTHGYENLGKNIVNAIEAGDNENLLVYLDQIPFTHQGIRNKICTLLELTAETATH